jgi:hypothetical protein
LFSTNAWLEQTSEWRNQNPLDYSTLSTRIWKNARIALSQYHLPGSHFQTRKTPSEVKISPEKLNQRGYRRAEASGPETIRGRKEAVPAEAIIQLPHCMRAPSI